MNKTTSRTSLLVGFLTTSLMACAAPPADSRADLEAAIGRWVEAVNSNDTDTLNATMSEDIELADGSSTITGRDAAVRTLNTAARDGKLVATTRDITMAGDTAVHRVSLARARKNGDVQSIGDATETWKRIDGEWRLARRQVTRTTDPAISVTRPATKEPVLDRQPD